MKKSEYLSLRDPEPFEKRKRTHERYQASLEERFKEAGFRILRETYHEVWDRSEYLELLDGFHPLFYFIRYKPDFLAFRGGEGYWVEVKTSPREKEAYFPLTQTILAGILDEVLGLPILMIVKSPWLERAFFPKQLLRILPGELEVIVGSHLDTSDWEGEVYWIQELWKKAGWGELKLNLRRRQVSGSGRPFFALPQDQLYSLPLLESFLRKEHP